MSTSSFLKSVRYRMVSTKDDTVDTIDEEINQTELDDHSTRAKSRLRGFLDRDTQVTP